MSDDFISKLIKKFSKGLFVVTGLFSVLYCGIAALLLFNGECIEDKIFALIFACLPMIVFYGFLVFLLSRCKKFSSSSDNDYPDKKNREDIQKIKDVIKIFLEMIKNKPDLGKNIELLQELLNKMFELSSITNTGENNSKNKKSNNASIEDDLKTTKLSDDGDKKAVKFKDKNNAS